MMHSEKKWSVWNRLKDVVNKCISFKNLWMIVGTWMLWSGKVEGMIWLGLILAGLGLGEFSKHQIRKTYSSNADENNNKPENGGVA